MGFSENSEGMIPYSLPNTVFDRYVFRVQSYPLTFGVWKPRVNDPWICFLKDFCTDSIPWDFDHHEKPPFGQWLFLVPLKGGRWHIIPQLAVYTTYIPLIYCLLGGYMIPTTF